MYPPRQHSCTLCHDPQLPGKALNEVEAEADKVQSPALLKKAFPFQGPFTQGFVLRLPNGHVQGPSSISLIRSVGKTLKISFRFTLHPPFHWLLVIIIVLAMN